jgi:hypothetical protein
VRRFDVVFSRLFASFVGRNIALETSIRVIRVIGGQNSCPFVVKTPFKKLLKKSKKKLASS